MASKLCTTDEQSKKLLRIGINPETADMYRWWTSDKRFYTSTMDDGEYVETSDTPIWSLSALMDILDGVVLGKTGTDCFAVITFKDGDSLKSVKCTGESYVDAYMNLIITLKEETKETWLRQILLAPLS